MKKGYSVPVQKGGINPAQSTMKHSMREEKVMADAQKHAMLHDMKTLKFHTPKQ